MVLVIDDALLLAVLAGSAPHGLRDAMRRGELFTTGTWYYRLARAASDPTFSGALSSVIEALAPGRQTRVSTGLDRLPDEVGLLGMRRLVPIMRRLNGGRRLNFLNAEAVAAALSLGAGLRVTTDSRLLREACLRFGVDHHILLP